MSVLSIFFGQKRSSIGSITIDATIREAHESTLDITTNPIEGGAEVPDHAHIEPKMLTMEGVISDTPLSISVLSDVEGITGTIMSLFGQKSRSISAYDALVKLQEKREPFTVVTGLKVYKNMLLKSLSVPRDAQTGKAIVFTATLQEVQFVYAETTDAEEPASDVADMASPTRDMGSTQTNELMESSALSSTNSILSTASIAAAGALEIFMAWRLFR